MLWKNYNWNVRNGAGGPGPNTFKSNNVKIDGAGNLVLSITNQNGIWTCAEVDLDHALGYGDYWWKVASPIKYDKNVVAAGFTYLDDNNELDIEYSYWGGTLTNVGFTVQPAPYNSTNNIEFNVVEGVTGYQQGIHFFPGDVSFFIKDVNGNTLKSWKYNGTVKPSSAMVFMFNLWLFQGKAPATTQTMSISDFTFTPQGNLPPAVTITQEALQAGFSASQAAFLDKWL